MENKNGNILIVLLAILLLIPTSVTGYLYMQSKNTQKNIEIPQPTILETITPTLIPKTTLTVTKSITRAPTFTPTPTPIPPDYRFSTTTSLVRSYNDGSGRGALTTTTNIQSNQQFDSVLGSWNDSLQACVTIVDSVNTPNIWISLTVSDNNAQIFAKDVHPGEKSCLSMPISSAVHNISLTINPGHSIRESSYTNNTMQFTYTIKGDTQAPTFEIFGPTKEPDAGTCMFAQHLTDNITQYIDIKIEQYIDNSLRQPDQYGRVCIQGTAGESHAYKAIATDTSGNKNEQTKEFLIP